MLKTYTCIICPNGCEIEVQLSDSKEITAVNGQTCSRGESYVRQEILSPTRTIATSVLVINGEKPLASVRITKPVPKAKIFQVMDEIRKLKVTAPVKAGTTLIHNICGEDSDLILTKTVAAKKL